MNYLRSKVVCDAIAVRVFTQVLVSVCEVTEMTVPRIQTQIIEAPVIVIFAQILLKLYGAA